MRAKPQNYMKIASAPEQKRNGVADLSMRKAYSRAVALSEGNSRSPSVSYRGARHGKAQHADPVADDDDGRRGTQRATSVLRGLARDA